MKKRMMKRAAAAAMTGVMAVSMSSVAFAAVSEIDLKKQVTTDGKTYAPAETFAFAVTEGTAGTFNGAVVYAGVAGGLVLNADNDFNFTPGDGDPVAATYEKPGKITVDASVFEKPGIYHYEVTEVQGSYEGMDYDNSKRDVYLYVVNGASGLEVDSVVTSVDGTKQKSLTFVNVYGDGGEEDKIYDLTVTKKVTGNQGDKTAAFEFNVGVTGTAGEKYLVEKTDQNNEVTTQTLTSGAELTKISLKDGESLHIYGLSAGDTYTVNEEDYTVDGYTTTNGTNNGNLKENGVTIEVTNDKNVTTPTGIVTTFAPHVLMLGAAGAAGGMFLRKKKEDF